MCRWGHGRRIGLAPADGTYTTEELTAEDAVAALRAGGVEIDEQLADAIDSEIGDQTYTVSIVFDSGPSFNTYRRQEDRPKSGPKALTRCWTTPWKYSKPAAKRCPSGFSFDGQALDLRLNSEDDEVQAACDEQPLD